MTIVNQFPTKKHAIDYYYANIQSKPNLYMIAKDYNTRGGKRFLVYNSFNDFLTDHENENHKFFYEIIDAKINRYKVKLFFDCDIKENNERYSYIEDCIQDIIDRVKTLIPYEDKDVIVLKTDEQVDADGLKKSYHLIFNNFYFDDMIACKDWVFKYFADYIDKNIIDNSVYRTGCFRMFQSSKFGKNYPFYVDNLFTPFEVSLKDTLITNIDNCSLIDYVVEKKKKEKKDLVIETPDNEILELVSLLDKKRYNNYQDWINIGILLFSIKECDEFLQFWIEQTKIKWDGFTDDMTDDDTGCKEKWDTFTEKNLTAGTLRFWLKQDGVVIPEKKNAFLFVTDLANCDVAKAYEIIKLCIPFINLNCILVNEDVYWFDKYYKLVSGLRLKRLFRHSLEDIVISQKYKWKNYENISSKLDIIQNWYSFDSKINELITTYKSELADGVEHNLDEDYNLLGFQDGILNLSTMIFYTCNPNFKVSKSTKLHYKKLPDYRKNNKYLQIVTSCYENKEMFEFEMKRLANSLKGADDERIYFITGDGSNGKGMIQMMIARAFGQYSLKADINLLTNKREGGHTTDLMACKSKRLVNINEVSSKDITGNMLKNLTSREDISGREIFGKQEEFRIKSSFNIWCNDLPTFDKLDGGIERRVTVIPYNLKFVDKKDFNKNNPYHRIKNPDLKNIIDTEDFGLFFMSLLLDYLKKENIPTPKIVEKATKNYLDNTNPIKTFIEEFIEFDDNSFITLSDVKDYMNENMCITIKDLKLNKGIDYKNFFINLAKTTNCEYIERKKVNNIEFRNIIKGLKLKKIQDDVECAF